MIELLKEIGQTAQRNKLRTGLTGFAVAWGIFMLIVLLGAGNGLINAQMSQFDRFLSNSMVLFGGSTTKPYQGLKEGRYIPLKNRDLDITKTEFKGTVDEVGATISQYGTTVSLGQQYLSNSLDGIFPNHFLIDKAEILHGRFINELDMREKRKVIVMGNKQAGELLGSQQASRLPALIGQFVKVNEFAFRVVGIYKQDENGEPNLYIPYTTLKAIFGKGDDAGKIEFSFHGLSTEEENREFELKYKRRLGASHQVAPDDDEAFWLWNRYTSAMQMQKGITLIHTALWIVGLFTLLSGIVGVSNIMLITVKERTHEFGIRKAIGAKPWSILKLIITESIIITTVYGYIGMVLGVAANEYMDATIGNMKIDAGLFKATMFSDPTVGIDVCIEATLVIIIAGTLAGLIPAMKAARIRPIEALRAE